MLVAVARVGIAGFGASGAFDLARLVQVACDGGGDSHFAIIKVEHHVLGTAQCQTVVFQGGGNMCDAPGFRLGEVVNVLLGISNDSAFAFQLWLL